MKPTKLVTMNMSRSKEKILKLRAISSGKTKSRFYRDIIEKYMSKNV